MNFNRRRFVVGSIVLLLVGGLLLALINKPREVGILNKESEATKLYDSATLAGLPQRSASSADTSHLAQGVSPPTNSWFSGMVLQRVPQAVFPMPHSFLAKEDGFEIGLPTISSTATSINGGHTPGLVAEIGATGFQLSRYDKLSATLTYRNDAKIIGELTISEGSPFVFYTAKQAGEIKLDKVDPAMIQERTDKYVRFNRAGQTYVISVNQGTIATSGDALVAKVPSGGLVTFYTLPSNNDSLKQYAGNAIKSVIVSYGQSEGTFATTFEVKTNNGKPTVFVSMPYAQAAGPTIETYKSIWGPMIVVAGKSFVTSVPAVPPDVELDVSKLSEDEKTKIIISLEADITSTKITQLDSYFAGKQLSRAANLLSLAEQLNQTASADRLKSILNEAFASRLNGEYFYYDNTLNGVAASTAAFGSEDFNDHHFHYGYWLYAGSIMAKYDKSFLDNHKDGLNLLAADIASQKTNSDFPEIRNYDPYAGHSWAAGLAPFMDGNNQESSSEAIHAWNGVAMWGKATNNKSLELTGQWLLANEANTAQKAWRAVDVSDPSLKNYTSPVTSLNFSGKRTYSTFFSDEPSAKLGIQLIPMDPGMKSFKSDDGTITKSISLTIKNDNYNVPLGDYILMYLSLSQPTEAASLAEKQTLIDDGNSKSYLLAWISSK